MSVGFIMTEPQDVWKHRTCSRCKSKFKDAIDMKVGYGWYVFCASCERSFLRWLDYE